MAEYLVIVIRGLLALLLACGAYRALGYGWRLYREGIGEKADNMSVSGLGIAVKARTVGAVVMITASFWAWVAVRACPKYERSSAAETVKIANAGYVLKADPVMIRPSGSAVAAMSNPHELKGLFRRAIAERQWHANAILLNDRPARYDPNVIEVSNIGPGRYLIKTQVRTPEKVVTVYFRTQQTDGLIEFRPWDLALQTTDGTDPNNASVSDGNTGGVGSLPENPAGQGTIRPLPLE